MSWRCVLRSSCCPRSPSLVLALGCGRTALIGAAAAPVAVIAPAPVEVERGARVELSGRESFDPEGMPLAFSWSLVGRPGGATAWLEGTTDPQARLTPDVEGAWEVELHVAAGARRSAPVTAIVSVRQPTPARDGGSEGDGGPGDAFDAPDAGRPDGGEAIDSGLALDGGLHVLDPDEVYVLGTVSPGACYRDALAHWATPHVAAVAFDCYLDEEQAVIRPTDGRLLYVNFSEDLLREFHCDACPYSGTYPAPNLVPDVVVPTPCPVGETRLSRFRVSADGEVLHACTLSWGVWRDKTGASVFDGTVDGLVVAGAGGWLLSQSRVVSRDGGVTAAITGLPTSSAGLVTWLAARWSPPDGFLIAVATWPEPSLWRVDLHGVAQHLGDYPPPPAGFTSEDWSAKLDGAGRLFTQGIDRSDALIDVIVRREAGGAADIVYTERTNPLVKLHMSALVTGP